MSIFKFRITWQDDDNVQRDIEILSSQTFMQLHEIIKSSFALDKKLHANFHVLNAAGLRERTVNTAVEKNLKDAPALSAIKTPIGALVKNPHQEFIYALENDREWDFTIYLIDLDRVDVDPKYYPVVVRSEGVNPTELVSKGVKIEKLIETEEKYDLEDKDGFGEEGEDNGNTDEESYGEDDNQMMGLD
jgi:Plasmid pRiA4b ORF-3-like protein